MVKFPFDPGHEEIDDALLPCSRDSDPTRNLRGPLRPLRGSRFALRQPDACGAGAFPLCEAAVA